MTDKDLFNNAGTIDCPITSCSMEKEGCSLSSDPLAVNGVLCVWGSASSTEAPVGNYPTSDIYIKTTDAITGSFDLMMRGDMLIHTKGGN